MSSTVFEIGLCIGTFPCRRKGMQLSSLQEPGFRPLSEQCSKNRRKNMPPSSPRKLAFFGQIHRQYPVQLLKKRHSLSFHPFVHSSCVYVSGVFPFYCGDSDNDC